MPPLKKKKAVILMEKRKKAEYRFREIGLHSSRVSGHENDNNNDGAPPLTPSLPLGMPSMLPPLMAGSSCQLGASGAVARRHRRYSDDRALRVGPRSHRVSRSGQKGVQGKVSA